MVGRNAISSRPCRLSRPRPPFKRCAWNTCDPTRAALAYTADSRWRNCADLMEGREAIEAFLARKWQRGLNYRLVKEVWEFGGNRVAVRFAYEAHNSASQWFRS